VKQAQGTRPASEKPVPAAATVRSCTPPPKQPESFSQTEYKSPALPSSSKHHIEPAILTKAHSTPSPLRQDPNVKIAVDGEGSHSNVDKLEATTKAQQQADLKPETPDKATTPPAETLRAELCKEIAEGLE